MQDKAALMLPPTVPQKANGELQGPLSETQEIALPAGTNSIAASI